MQFRLNSLLLFGRFIKRPPMYYIMFLNSFFTTNLLISAFCYFFALVFKSKKNYNEKNILLISNNLLNQKKINLYCLIQE